MSAAAAGRQQANQKPAAAANLLNLDFFRQQVDSACYVTAEDGYIICATQSLEDAVNDGQPLESCWLGDVLASSCDLPRILHECRKQSETLQTDVVFSKTGKSAVARFKVIKTGNALEQACISCSFSFSTRLRSLYAQSETIKDMAIDAMPYALHAMNIEGDVSVSNLASHNLFQTLSGTQVYESGSLDLRQWSLTDEQFQVEVPLEDYPIRRAMRGEEIFARYGCIMPDHSRKLIDVQARTLADSETGAIIGGAIYALDRTLDVQQALQMEYEKAQLKQDAENAEEANKTKTTFLSTISHEIRTPIAALLGLIDLLLATDLSDTQLDYAQTIRSQVSFLLNLVSEVLDLNKVEAGRLQLEVASFDFRDLMEDIAKVTRYSLAGGSPAFEAILNVDDDLPLVLGDRGRLRQIVANLLGNAIKFAQNGKVIFTVNAELERGGVVRCTLIITDNGIGASPEQLGRVFQPFSQAESSTSRLYGGSGLGLSICRTLLQEMHGEVSLTSPGLGKGCTATVQLSLPVYMPSRPQSSTDHHTQYSIQHSPSGINSSRSRSSIASLNQLSHSQSRRGSESDFAVENQKATVADGELEHPRQHYIVLIAEDNEILLKITCEMVAKMGFRHIRVTNGQAAVNAVTTSLESNDSEHTISLVLMDLWMPGMSGLDASRVIRQRLDASDLPIIALTASILSSERENVLANGLQAYFSKPVKYNVLEQEIVAQLCRSETSRRQQRMVLH